MAYPVRQRSRRQAIRSGRAIRADPSGTRLAAKLGNRNRPCCSWARPAPAKNWWRARSTAPTGRLPSSSSIAPRWRHADGERAVRPREGRLHRRRRPTRSACSKRPTAAPPSSTRSASCRSDLQAKLLRVLRRSEFRPVGATTTATVELPRHRRDQPRPRDEVERGRFRQDLYYRLNVVPAAAAAARAQGRYSALVEHFLGATATAQTTQRRSAGDADRLRLAGQRARAGELHPAHGGGQLGPVLHAVDMPSAIRNQSREQRR